MTTILEDLQKVISETNQAQAYWEGFKELYLEKAQWNLEGKRLTVETTNDLAMQEDIAHWKIWQVTKAILTIFPDIQKLKFKVPTYQYRHKRRGIEKKKIWLIYDINMPSYYHFLHELTAKKKITNEKGKASLFGYYFAENRNRRAA